MRGLCAALGTASLEVRGQFEPGLPHSLIRGGRWDGATVVSKSGASAARRSGAICCPPPGTSKPQLRNRSASARRRLEHEHATWRSPWATRPGSAPRSSSRPAGAGGRGSTGATLRLLIIGSNARWNAPRAAFAPELDIPAVRRRRRLAGALLPAGGAGERADRARACCRRMAAASPTWRSSGRAPGAGRAGRRHRHRAAEQGGAEQGRLPLRRPHRDAGRADRRARLGDDAGARQHAGQPRHHACRTGGRAEAR